MATVKAKANKRLLSVPERRCRINSALLSNRSKGSESIFFKILPHWFTASTGLFLRLDVNTEPT